MRKITRFILTGWVSAVMLCSCDICRSREEGRVRFSEGQRHLVPYKKGSVIGFSGKNGESVDWIVTEKERGWSHCDIFEEVMCSDYILFESEDFKLQSESGNFKMYLYQRLYTTLTDDDARLLWNNSCIIHLGITHDYGDWEKFISYELRFDENGMFSPDNRKTFFHEKLEINGKTYDEVLELNQEISALKGDRKQNARIFYDKAYGLLLLNIAGTDVLTIRQ